MYQVFGERWNRVFLEGFESADAMLRWIVKNLPAWKLEGLKLVSPSGFVYTIRKKPV